VLDLTFAKSHAEVRFAVDTAISTSPALRQVYSLCPKKQRFGFGNDPDLEELLTPVASLGPRGSEHREPRSAAGPPCPHSQFRLTAVL